MVIRKMRLRTTMREHFTLLRMAIIKINKGKYTLAKRWRAFVVLPVGTRNRAAAGENRSPRIPIRAGRPGPRYVPPKIEDRCSNLVREFL